MLTCPACAKTVDPLRAGHVAFLDGRFVYFCSAQHKADFLAGGGIAKDDVETSAPPVVAPPRKQAEPPPPRESEPPPLPPPLESSPPEPPPPSSLPARIPAPVHEPHDPQDTSALPLVGAAAGVLAVAVRLVGPALDATELPLALTSIAALGVVLLRSPSRAVRAPQLAGALTVGALAIWARVTGDWRAPMLASLAGVSAAGGLAADIIAARAEAVIDRSRRRIADRLDLDAKVVSGDDVITSASEDVRAGQQLIVETGEVSAVDGFVVAGEGVVLPWAEAPADMNKKENDAIAAGAQVVSGTLRIRATRTGSDRAWLKLTLGEGRVEVASPLPRVARWIVLLGGFAAALLACVAGALSGLALVDTLAAAAAALVALSAPGPAIAVAVRHARGQLAALAHGIVYKDASAFDRAGQVDVAVACARGTLLLGEPEVVAIEPLGTSTETARMLELAAGAMSGSTHPFAHAILRTAHARGARPENVRNAVHAGSGATALVASSEKLVVGRRAFLLSERVSVAAFDARTTELEAQGRSVLLVALGGKVIGLVALQDGLRAGARAAVQRLHDARIEPVLMSGEARETCETIGRALDIEHVRPEVAPSDRAAEVRALGGGAHVVAVFGHPIRDDGALGAADVSVALGAAGAAPGEWAVVLASEDVRDAALALTIPQQVRDGSRVALALGIVLPMLGALSVVLIGLPWVIAPLAAFVGSSAALLYAKE